MNKEVVHSYKGMKKDITKSKFSNEYYFEGKNIKITSTDSQSLGSVSNMKGNSLLFTIPALIINYTNKTISYNNKILNYTTPDINFNTQSSEQYIISTVTTRNFIILLTTDNNGFDCIWKVNDVTYELTLLYLRNLEFSTANPPQILNNFENDKIDKIYWVDSKNQTRFLNLNHSIENGDLEELIDIPVTVIDMVGKYDLSQPVIQDVLSGGIHTSGMIQYAYNLYRLNSSQTKISPLSELVSLDKNSNGGGVVNEVVSALPVINIDNIDSNYSHIKVYAIKYTSYNEIPSVSIIDDRTLPSTGNIKIFDDGKIIKTISLEEFMFLGSDIVIPKHINSKFNRLFLANYKEINFNVDIDTRAYSYGFSTNILPSLEIYNNESGGLIVEQGLIPYANSYGNAFQATENLNITFTTYDDLQFTAEQPDFSYIIVYTLNGLPIAENSIIYLFTGDILSFEVLLFGEGTINGGSAGFANIIKNNNTINTGSLHAKVYKNLTTTPTTITDPYYPFNTRIIEKPTGTFFDIVNDVDYDDVELIKHDSINLDYDVYKFQKNGVTFGGEGKYLKYELTKSSIFNEDNKYFKDDEIYRIGIQFYNSYGQISLPNWIADFKALDGNLNGQYNTLSVTLKPEFFTWLNTTLFETKYDIPVGYKIIVAERTANDKTIVANGLLTPMMVNYKAGEQQQPPFTTFNLQADSLPKLPNILARNYNKNTLYGIAKPLRKSLHLAEMSINRNSSDNEMPRADRGDVDTVGRVYQFNSMLQLYSPEIIFNEPISLSESTQLRIKGSLKNNINNAWGRIYETDIQGQINDEVKVTNGLTSHFLQPGGSIENVINGQTSPWGRGLVTSVFTNDYSKAGFVMYDRVYGGNEPTDINTGLYQKAPNSIKYDIYGAPELVEKGQSDKNYNNDPKYRYTNSFESILTDSGKSDYDDAENSRFRGKIVSINSYGNKSITFVPGNDSFTTEHFNRPTHESLGLSTGITGDNNGLIGELVKSDIEIYLGNIYGGNTYEDKKRTNYIEIGNYRRLNSLQPTVTINSPGDTFVNFFKFARIVKTDKDIISEGTFVLHELITILSETTIDLKNRSDISFNDWKTKFQPSDNEYHNYNKVYSQQPTLIQRRTLDYNIKKFNNFDTNIISTKLKSAGELIDNWTDLSTNDVITLDGKYGPINALPNFNDEIYSLQDSALAFISVNPRVQVQGGDGLSIELGSGSVLDRYKYMSTTSGTLNKWSVTPTPNGLYYYDLLNKTLNVFSGQLTKLSDVKGLHTQFNNDIIFNDLKIDNPLFLTGITSGYDYINNDLYMTFKQSSNIFTICYNEMLGEFISLKDGVPSIYTSKGNNFLTTSQNNRSLYRENEGLYNNFYNVYYPSYITLNVNPEADKDCIFNNVEYKSEVYNNNEDLSNDTLTSVQIWNEYQSSNLTPLVLNSNLSRKFRNWTITLPRNKNSRDRIRNPWIFLKLEFNNTLNKKLILHNMSIHYTV